MILTNERIDYDLSGESLFPNQSIGADWVSQLEGDPSFRSGQLSEGSVDAWVHASHFDMDVDAYILDLDQNDSYQFEIAVDEPGNLSSNRGITVWQADGRYVDLVMNSSGLEEFDGTVLASDVFKAEAGGRYFAFTRVRNASGEDAPVPYRIELVKTEDAAGWSIDWRPDGDGAVARLDPGDNTGEPRNFTLVFDAPNATVEQSFAQSTINGRVVSQYSVQQTGDTVTFEVIGFSGVPEITFQGGQGAGHIRLIEGTVSFHSREQIVKVGDGYILPSIFVGTNDADNLVGSDGNDTFTGAAGNDTLIGGGGQDTAVYSGARSDYDIAPDDAGNLIVTDQRDGGDGTDTLRQVETLQFSDGTVDTGDFITDVTLAGQITDTGGTALAGVDLTVLDAGGAALDTLTSDAAGRFSTTLPDVEARRLEASRDYDLGTDPTITALDALDVLRLAVGLAPSFGPAQAQNFVAADINVDNAVTALDALEVLRAAVGLDSVHAPRWAFFDAATDWDGVAASRAAVNAPEAGIDLSSAAPGADLGLTGILLGNMGFV